MGAKISSMGNAIYDSKRREFLGRDGGRWAKLAVFYFFFYVGLAGFFCAMLAIFMAISPRDRPRYYSESSRMGTRTNPVAPGLGFRPQPSSTNNLISFEQAAADDEDQWSYKKYVKSLDHYLQSHYGLLPNGTSLVTSASSRKNTGGRGGSSSSNSRQEEERRANSGEAGSEDRREQPFRIRSPGDCTSANNYGYSIGKPCVLVKMNKIVGFEPQARDTGNAENNSDQEDICEEDGHQADDVIHIKCTGEYPADADNIGPIRYHSETKGNTKKCGSLLRSRYPYQGKINRKDRYQAPYVWVQFDKPPQNLLVNVLCRLYGSNIDFDKKTARAMTRFQIYVRYAEPQDE